MRDANPAAAYDALRRGLTIAQGSGNRMIESYLATGLPAFASNCDPTDALDFLTWRSRTISMPVVTLSWRAHWQFSPVTSIGSDGMRRPPPSSASHLPLARWRLFPKSK
ncbi:hypothetical protein [Mycobacterium sp. Aquia_213]|uniref:hypothetical protein n=1 Tax=Mycobacterium sp. Aquia_213 TaxID=2991728 RepID=UPI00226F74AB|nr:hypothetical protein [Mycobacterium sp. Aquia_213]WAC93201.1 hypothetical protein LMQ14_08755 [Mycobacterium sp. Aquia_213]